MVDKRDGVLPSHEAYAPSDLPWRTEVSDLDIEY